MLTRGLISIAKYRVVAETNALRIFRLWLVPNETLIEFRFPETIDKSVKPMQNLTAHVLSLLGCLAEKCYNQYSALGEVNLFATQ